MTRRGGALPAIHLAVAVVLALLVLPSALRPPPDQAQQSSALSPDAPPDESSDVIVQSLRQAASRTAGATGGDGAAPTSTTTTVLKPSRGQCFGDPRRQTESAYAPPCRPAFVGDNGGATWKNVTGDRVRVAYWHVGGMPRSDERGPVPDVATPGESDELRTARVIQGYFNDRYELYGRRLQLVAITNDSWEPPDQRAAALESDQLGVFASTHLFFDYCDEMARRDLICLNQNPFRHEQYLAHAPKFWSYQAEDTVVDRWAAAYACKKLVGRTADFAGPGIAGEPRKLGVLVESYYGNGFRRAQPLVDAIRDACGHRVEYAADVTDAEPDQIAAAMVQMRSNGVTTIIMESEIPSVAAAMAFADSNAYYPEWFMVSSYGLDDPNNARLLPASQRAHYFGGAGWELPHAFEESDCFRAYKSVDPTGSPSEGFCLAFFADIEQIMNGIQEAGPTLTPESFRDGLFAMPLEEPRYPWSITGQYGPDDYSFVDSFTEFWWDDTATDPFGSEPGTLRYTEGGRRWRLHELDDVWRVGRVDGSVRGYGVP